MMAKETVKLIPVMSRLKQVSKELDGVIVWKYRLEFDDGDFWIIWAEDKEEGVQK